MSDFITVDVDDESRFLEATTDEVTTSRATLLKRAVFAGGTLMAGGVVISGLPKLALGAPSTAQDVEILNFALLLEYLEAEFYTRAQNSGALRGEARRFARIAGAHERAHVRFLQKALGEKARSKPEFDFKGATRNQRKFLATAVVFEDTGVGAYNGAGPLLTKKTLAAAASIVAVEAYHAAWVRDIVRRTPAPAAFDPLLSRARVTRRIDPFIAE